MPNQVIKLPIYDLQIELVPMPQGEGFEAKVFGNVPRGNGFLDAAVNAVLLFLGAAAASGMDMQDEKFERALRQTFTHLVRSLGSLSLN